MQYKYDFSKIIIFKKIVREEGQGLTEYGLILLLVSTAAIVAMSPIGGRLFALFQQISEKI